MSRAIDWKGTTSFARTIASGIVALVGAVILVSVFANNLFAVGTDFEAMIDDFRPVLTEESVATAKADLTLLAGVGTEFETTIVPTLSQQLEMTDEEFTTLTASNFPAVANGIEALPQIVPTLNGLVDTLDSQRELFESADAIPTESLPATTVPWGLLLTAIGLILISGVLFKPGWLGLALTGGAGVSIVAVALILNLVPKANDADELNDNLRPVYTPELVAEAEAALVTVSAMGAQMQGEMLPSLGQQLGMTSDELNAFLSQTFPQTAAALQSFPEALGRFQNLTEIFANNLENYETVEPVSFAPIIWTLLIGGLVVLGAFGLAWWGSGQRDVRRQAASAPNPDKELIDVRDQGDPHKGSGLPLPLRLRRSKHQGDPYERTR